MYIYIYIHVHILGGCNHSGICKILYQSSNHNFVLSIHVHAESQLIVRLLASTLVENQLRVAFN